MSFEYYCGHCMSSDVEIITEFDGEEIEPEPCTDGTERGDVVKCKKCHDITGWSVHMRGVVPIE